MSSLPPSLIPHLYPVPTIHLLVSDSNLLPPLASWSADIWTHSKSGFIHLKSPAIPPLPPLQYDRRDALTISPPRQRPNTPLPDSTHASQSTSNDPAKDKRPRDISMDTDNNPKKSSRKTAVACNFCRGRKLRCDGLKPLCTNCERRKYDCEYVSTQRRRGPGKAPKGSRSRKARSEHSGSSSRSVGDPLPSMVPDFEFSPDLRPFVSVMSLDTFGYHPPDTCPLYPSHRHDRDPLIMRQHSHLRMSRSREISLEDHSDIHKNQSGS